MGLEARLLVERGMRDTKVRQLPSCHQDHIDPLLELLLQVRNVDLVGHVGYGPIADFATDTAMGLSPDGDHCWDRPASPNWKTG